jgi:DNA-binding NtrC family response regulator
MKATAMSSHHSTGVGRLREPVAEPQSRNLPREVPAALDRSDWVLLGESAAVRQLRSQVHRIAPYVRTVLIRGESGVGKQAVAQAIHARSPGAAGQFVVRDARALAEVVERSPGSRAADASAESVLQGARGGTLHLTRVGELSFSQQAALFSFLRSCEEHLGSGVEAGRKDAADGDPRRATTRELDTRRNTTRILVATDRDLRTLAAIGQFRQDLYARLSAVEIFVPPLRQRAEDVRVLAEWLLRQLCEKTGQPNKALAESTARQLQERPWPENLRELERVVARAAALADGGTIEPRHLLALVEAGRGARTGSSTGRIERLQQVVERHVLEVLTRCDGNKLRAAELLGISRSTLYRMLGARAESGRVLSE